MISPPTNHNSLLILLNELYIKFSIKVEKPLFLLQLKKVFKVSFSKEKAIFFALEKVKSEKTLMNNTTTNQIRRFKLKNSISFDGRILLELDFC